EVHPRVAPHERREREEDRSVEDEPRRRDHGEPEAASGDRRHGPRLRIRDGLEEPAEEGGERHPRAGEERERGGDPPAEGLEVRSDPRSVPARRDGEGEREEDERREDRLRRPDARLAPNPRAREEDEARERDRSERLDEGGGVLTKPGEERQD